MDMKTQVMPYSSPEMQGLGVAQSHYYGLPFFGLSGCSDAKVLDGQATLEASLTLMADILSGSNLIHDLGYLESGLCASLQLLTICDEIIEWIKGFTNPIKVNPETLALDVIDEIGPQGHFISCDHTLRHFKENYYPKSPSGWRIAAALANSASTAAKFSTLTSFGIRTLIKWMPTPGSANFYMSSSMVGSVARSTKPNDARG